MFIVPMDITHFQILPMNEKDWKEADLIFDIDAKDLNLPCRESHTISICNECNRSFTKISIPMCQNVIPLN